MIPARFTVTVLLLATCSGAGAPAPLPTFKAVEERVQRTLEREADYQDGDLLVRSMVERVLNQLKALGWEVPRPAELLRQVLPDDDFVARSLYSEDGRAFMRQIKGLPQGYDRVERLARLPRGEATLRSLVRGPGGAKMIEYLATAKGGVNLGAQLSKIPDAGDFNRSTGRIYTARALLVKLRSLHDESARPAATGAAGKARR